MDFSKNTLLKDIDHAPAFRQMTGHFISSAQNYLSGEKEAWTLQKLQQENPTWNAEDVIFGLERLQQVAIQNKQYVFPVYTQDEIKKNPPLAQAQLIWLPAQKKRHTAFAILASGGAYGAVCTMVESLPVAARLNELGMDCFCLNYRTARQESFISGLMPAPLDDLAAAWQFIDRNRKLFGVNSQDYIVGGFSAGGHLCAMWGTEHMGYRKYGIPAPQMLIPVYPMVTMENFPDGPLKAYMCQGLCGASYTQADIMRYAVNRHIDHRYPKTYLVQCEDDQTVSVANTRMLANLLQQAGVACRLEIGNHGGHGFGLGTVTDVAGWADRALEFLKEE